MSDGARTANLHELLDIVLERGASDLHLTKVYRTRDNQHLDCVRTYAVAGNRIGAGAPAHLSSSKNIEGSSPKQTVPVQNRPPVRSGAIAFRLPACVSIRQGLQQISVVVLRRVHARRNRPYGHRLRGEGL